MRYVTQQNTLEHHLISSFLCISEAATPQTPYTLTTFTIEPSAAASLRLAFVMTQWQHRVSEKTTRNSQDVESPWDIGRGKWLAGPFQGRHLSVHQWIRSAIPDSQQPISPIGFLFLKLPPPPCAVLLVVVDYAGVILLLKTIWVKGSGVSKGAEGYSPVWWTAAGRGQRHQIAMRYVTQQNTLEHHLISSFLCISEAATPQTPYTLTTFTIEPSAAASLRLAFVMTQWQHRVSEKTTRNSQDVESPWDIGRGKWLAGPFQGRRIGNLRKIFTDHPIDMKGLSVNQYYIAVLNTTPKLLKRGTMGKMAPRNIFIDTKCLKNANFRSTTTQNPQEFFQPRFETP